MKYTPGPWHAGEIGRKGLGWCTIFADTIPIARALSIHKNGERQSGDFDIESANARLIAAAPDMYEALKDLTRIIVTIGDINALNDAVKNALDAINKANGK